MTPRLLRRAALGTVVFAAGLFLLPDASALRPGAGLVPVAEATIGRPLTPLSVAGVARRTTRRTIRRTAAYVNTLPRGCATVTINATLLHQCGTVYYQPVDTRFVVVTVD